MTGDEHDLVRALEDDLAALAAADADLERDAEVAERTRIERSAVTLADRLRGAGAEVRLTLVGSLDIAGVPADSGDGWVLLVDGRDEHLVLLAHVVLAHGLGPSVPPASSALDRRPAGSVLRRWCRDRSEAALLTADGGTTRGLLLASYADHVDARERHGAVVSVAVAQLVCATRRAALA
jgi:hypothetical protein